MLTVSARRQALRIERAYKEREVHLACRYWEDLKDAASLCDCGFDCNCAKNLDFAERKLAALSATPQ